MNRPISDIAIDRDGHTAPYQQLYQELRRRIEDGKLKSGDQLPPVSDLMRISSLSRATVVRALAELAREGVIISRWGSGNFVADAPTPTTELLVLANRADGSTRLGVFYDEFIHGLETSFADPQRRIAVSYLHCHQPSEREIVEMLRVRRADSLIVYRREPALENELCAAAEQVPTVILFYPLAAARADAVVTDPTAILRTALEQRLAAGRRTFFFHGRRRLAEMGEWSPYAAMHRTFCEVMAAAGIEPDVCLTELETEAATVCARLQALPEDAVVVGYQWGYTQRAGRRLDTIAYTESRTTLDAARRHVSMIYLNVGRVVKRAVELLLERRESDAKMPARSECVAPEMIEAPAPGPT